jgi:superfamily II DNA/RNA helicase
VATPGRLLDLATVARRRPVSLENLRWLVVEEAEAALGPSMGAAVRDVVALRGGSGDGGGSGHSAAAGAEAEAEAAAEARAPLQTVLVASSAGDLGALRAAAADLLRPGAALVAGAMPAGAAASPAAPAARQRVVGVAGKLKPRALLRLLSDAGAGGGASLVCCATAGGADRVHAALAGAGVAERDEALQCFRFGVTRVLVACGVAARGLDLPDVTHVINYDPPEDEVEYAKRLARLGRGAGPAAGAPGGGGATTLVCPEDAPRAAALARALRAAGAAAPEWLVEMAEQAAAASAGGGGGGNSLGGAHDGAGGGVGAFEGASAAAGRLFSVRRRAGAAAPRFGSYLPMPVRSKVDGAAGGHGGGESLTV